MCLNESCNPFTLNDDGLSVLDLANELPESSDKAVIWQLLKDSINEWATHFTEDQIAAAVGSCDQRDIFEET
jgi:hypothetical protein